MCGSWAEGGREIVSEGADPMPSQSARWMPVRAGLTISASFAMICVSVTAASLMPAANAPDGMLGAVGDLAEVLVDDSAWLLPLLFGAVLAALAVLVGQSFTGLPPADVDVNRRRLAAMCWVVAGVAVADLVVVAIGAALRAALAPHVWAVTVASALIVASALWVGSVVFGPPEQQLRVLAHTIDEAERDAARIPPANRSGRPWLRLLTSAAATSATAAILAVGLVVVVMSVEGRWGGFGVVGSLAVWSAVLASAGCLPAALAAALMQSSERAWQGAAWSAAFAVTTVALPIGAIASTQGLVFNTLLPLAAAYALPTLLTLMGPRTWLRGHTLRGGVDAVYAKVLRGRLRSLREERRRLVRLIAARTAETPTGPQGLHGQ